MPPVIPYTIAMASLPIDISVQDLALLLAQTEDDRQLIDVREPHEVAIASLPGFDVLPLSEFAQWSEEIKGKYDPTKETVVLCHHGIRSHRMACWLVDLGFTNVKNVTGGIDAYARLVDRGVARY